MVLRAESSERSGLEDLGALQDCLKWNSDDCRCIGFVERPNAGIPEPSPGGPLPENRGFSYIYEKFGRLMSSHVL